MIRKHISIYLKLRIKYVNILQFELLKFYQKLFF